MSHKKGGFVALRHNDLRDLTSKILSELCSDTEIEPKTAPLGCKDFNPSRPGVSKGSIKIKIILHFYFRTSLWCLIRARGLWKRGQ